MAVLSEAMKRCALLNRRSTRRLHIYAYLVPAVSVFRLYNRLVHGVVLQASDHVRHNEVVAAGPCRWWYQNDVLPLARMLVRLVHLWRCVGCVMANVMVSVWDGVREWIERPCKDIWHWRCLYIGIRGNKTKTVGWRCASYAPNVYILGKQHNCYLAGIANRDVSMTVCDLQWSEPYIYEYIYLCILWAYEIEKSGQISSQKKEITSKKQKFALSHHIIFTTNQNIITYVLPLVFDTAIESPPAAVWIQHSTSGCSTPTNHWMWAK